MDERRGSGVLDPGRREAAWAEEAVARLDLQESDEAVSAEDYDRARALLRSAREKIRDDAATVKIDERLGAVEQVVASCRNAPKH